MRWGELVLQYTAWWQQLTNTGSLNSSLTETMALAMQKVRDLMVLHANGSALASALNIGGGMRCCKAKLVAAIRLISTFLEHLH